MWWVRTRYMNKKPRGDLILSRGWRGIYQQQQQDDPHKERIFFITHHTKKKVCFKNRSSTAQSPPTRILLYLLSVDRLVYCTVYGHKCKPAVDGLPAKLTPPGKPAVVYTFVLSLLMSHTRITRIVRYRSMENGHKNRQLQSSRPSRNLVIEQHDK